MHPGSYLGVKGDPDYTDLRATARRFLDFERGFLRRRWASYYALWACAAVAYFLVPFLASYTGFAKLPSSTQLLAFTGFDVVVTAAAVAVTLRLWGLAGRTYDLRSATDGLPSLTSRRNLVRFVVILAIVVASLAVSTLSDFASYLMGDTALIALSLLLLLHLHRAFRPVPFEGWLAAAAFITAAAGSYVSLLLFDSRIGHEIAWFAAVVVLLGCAAYAQFGVEEGPPGAG